MTKRASAFVLIAAVIIGVVVFENKSRGGQPQSFAPRFAVLPKTAKVFIGNGLQFHTALVGGTQQARIRWSVVGPGSIDPNGFYRSADVPTTADVVADAGGGITDSASVASVKPPAIEHPLLLYTCYEDGTVDVYDARTHAFLGAFSVGGRAAGIVVDAQARRAVFAVDAQLFAVDLARMRWRASAPIKGVRFSEVALLAGGYLAATDNLAEPGHPGVRIFRINAAGVPVLVSSATAGETPEGITAADSGHTFYVTAINSNLVMRFAVNAYGAARLTGSAQTAARPFGAGVDPVHHVLFVADNDTATLNGARANPGLERFSLPSMRRIGGVVNTGSKASLPLGVAVDSSESRLFVTNEGLADVAVFAIPSLKRISTLRAALTPWLPFLDARRHRLYVPNARADSISVYDTRSLREIAPAVPTCSYPTSVTVFNGEGRGR
jgi:DNA-binding beta-propeller fold protein YncE